MKKILSMTLIAAALTMPMTAMAETEIDLSAQAEAAVLQEAAEATAAADEALVAMPNPFAVCTEEEAFAQIGQTFVVVAPEGFTLSEAAKLADDQLAAGAAPLVRFAFTNEVGELYRVHITTDLAGLEPTEENPTVDVNGVQAIIKAQENSISFGLSNCAITIDEAGATEDELKGYIANVSAALAEAALEAADEAAPEEIPEIEAELTEAPQE